MENQRIKKVIFEILEPRMEILGIRKKEIKNDFDLVGSGMLSSMEFVEFVTRVEQDLEVEIDFESLLEEERITTLDVLVNIFKSKLHGGD